MPHLLIVTSQAHILTLNGEFEKFKMPAARWGGAAASSRWAKPKCRLLPHKAELPDGQITPRRESVSSPCAKNIWLGGLLDTALVIAAVPPQQEGRMRYRHETWGGMRWTRGAEDERRFARRSHLAKTGFPRTAKTCGPDAPTLASTGDDASHHACDGGKKARLTRESTK